MTTLYLIRHCEAFGNIHKRLHGVCDTDITPRGARQLLCLRGRMCTVELDAVYSSCLTRAYKTALAVADPGSLAVTRIKELGERDLGVLEDMTWHGAKTSRPEVFNAWRSDLFNYAIPDGESERASLERFRAALSDIARRHKGGTAAVVSHSMVIKTLFEREIFAGRSVPYADNTAISRLRYDAESDRFFADFVNDSAHLPRELSGFYKETWWKSGSGSDDYSLRFIDTKRTARECRDSDACGRVDAYSGDTHVGHGKFSLFGGRCTARVFVGEEHRRRGYGSQILGEIIARTRGLGAAEIALSPECIDRDFLLFCEKNGLAPRGDGTFAAGIEALGRV